LEIPGIKILSGRIKAHPDAVKAGIKKVFKGSWHAGVGVEVDGPLGCTVADKGNGLKESFPVGQRLSFTPLPKADNSIFRPFDVTQGYLGYLLRGGDEIDAILGAWDACVFLQRDTAKTGGVASGGGWEGCFVTSEKIVSGSRATVNDTAAGKVFDEAIPRMITDHYISTDVLLSILRKIFKVLTGVRVHTFSGCDETLRYPSQCRVRIKGEHRRVRDTFESGPQKYGVSGSQER